MTHKPKPRRTQLAGDVAAVIERQAKMAHRTLAQELDAILRPMFLAPQIMCFGLGPGEDGKRAVFPSRADVLEAQSRGLHFEWDERKKCYLPKKSK